MRADIQGSLPPAFKKMARNFIPYLEDVAGNWQELVTLGVHGLDGDDARELRPFLDQLLRAPVDHEALLELWSTSPASIYFTDGVELERLLRDVRQVLDRPEYR